MATRNLYDHKGTTTSHLQRHRRNTLQQEEVFLGQLSREAYNIGFEIICGERL